MKYIERQAIVALETSDYSHANPNKLYYNYTVFKQQRNETATSDASSAEGHGGRGPLEGGACRVRRELSCWTDLLKAPASRTRSREELGRR